MLSVFLYLLKKFVDLPTHFENQFLMTLVLLFELAHLRLDSSKLAVLLFDLVAKTEVPLLVELIVLVEQLEFLLPGQQEFVFHGEHMGELGVKILQLCLGDLVLSFI
jgi:hypothetical protein